MTGFFSRSEALARAPSPTTEFRVGLSHKVALCSSAAARKLVPVSLALKYRILPLRATEEAGVRIIYALVAPHFEYSRIKEIEFQLSAVVKVYHCDSDVLDDAILTAYYSHPIPLSKSIDDLDKRYTEREKASREQYEVDKHSPAFFLSRLLDHAVGLSASDIHIIPASEGVLITIRRFGQLLKHQHTIGNKQLQKVLTNRLCALCGIDLGECLEPADGSFIHYIEDREFHVRVSMLPCFYGVKIALRIQNGCKAFTLGELGLSTEAHDALEELRKKRAGFLLFSGSTGSGKTTSAYAVLEHFAARNLNVYSLEDPVERPLEGVTQIEIRNRGRLTFTGAFKALMRQDPDVIHVGEVRDQVLAQLSVEAALSGHIVTGTIHSQSVLAARKRLEILAGCGALDECVNGVIIHQELDFDIHQENATLVSTVGRF